jgi:hypothetical protein
MSIRIKNKEKAETRVLDHQSLRLDKKYLLIIKLIDLFSLVLGRNKITKKIAILVITFKFLLKGATLLIIVIKNPETYSFLPGKY